MWLRDEEDFPAVCGAITDFIGAISHSVDLRDPCTGRLVSLVLDRVLFQSRICMFLFFITIRHQFSQGPRSLWVKDQPLDEKVKKTTF